MGPSQEDGGTKVTLLAGTYQVVTQTRWMRPDAKRANRRQRRTGEARGNKQGGSQNGNTRHSYGKSRRNLGLSESWEPAWRATACQQQSLMASLMPRAWRQELHAHHQLCPRHHLTSLSWTSSGEKEK